MQIKTIHEDILTLPLGSSKATDAEIKSSRSMPTREKHYDSYGKNSLSCKVIFLDTHEEEEESSTSIPVM